MNKFGKLWQSLWDDSCFLQEQTVLVKPPVRVGGIGQVSFRARVGLDKFKSISKTRQDLLFAGASGFD